MKKILQITITMLFSLLLLVGCTSKGIPNEKKVAENLVGKSVDSILDSKDIDKVNSVKINATQNNYKTDKTCLMKATIDFDNEKGRANVTCDVNIEYCFYDDGGWIISSVELDDSSEYSMKPNFEVTDDELVKLIKSASVKYISPGGDKKVQGEFNETECSTTKENIKEVEILDKSDYNEKDKTINVKAKVKGKTELLDYEVEEEYTVKFNLPNLSISPEKVTKQTLTANIPEKLSGVYSANYRAYFYNITLNKDSNGNITAGVFTFRTDIPNETGSFKVIPTFDKETLNLTLKAGEWIQTVKGYEPIDIKFIIHSRKLDTHGAVYKVNSTEEIGMISIE